MTGLAAERRPFLAGRMGMAAVAALFLLSCGGLDNETPKISTAKGWTREVAPGQTAAAAYATIVNLGEGKDRLVGVGTPAATAAALHSSSSAGGVARMRPIADGLEIPAHSTVELKPGGTHIMLTGLKQRLRAGDKVDLTLAFAKSGQRSMTVHVRPATAEDGHSHGMKM